MFGSGGFLTLKKLWDELDLSLALSRSGIVKRSGVTPWALVFALIAGWFASKSSVNQTAEWAPTDDILTQIVGKVSQSALSRFLTRAFRWDLFNQERIRVLQDRPECRLTPKDVLALDDTKILHEHSKKIPFLLGLEELGFRFVTKAKSNTSFYELRPGKRPTDKSAYRKLTVKEVLCPDPSAMWIGSTHVIIHSISNQVGGEKHDPHHAPAKGRKT